MKYSFLACFWLFFASIQHTFHAASTSFRMIGSTGPSGKRKVEASRTTKDSLHQQIRLTALGGDVSCNCADYCLDPNSSEIEKFIWIENNPIFCKESGTIDIENKPYMKLCFFECCRSCNGQYHNCVQKSTPARQTCLKTAYECAGECSKKSSLNITIKGW